MFACSKVEKEPSNYVLCIESLGNDPDAVIDYLVNESGSLDHPSDLPNLPWEMLELPAGSDTFSVVHILGGDLAELSAKVVIKEIVPLKPPQEVNDGLPPVRRFWLSITFAVAITGMICAMAYILVVRSISAELREMHEHEISSD